MGRLQRCVFAVGFFGVCSGGVQCSHLNAVVTNAASKPSACFILLFAGFFFFPGSITLVTQGPSVLRGVGWSLATGHLVALGRKIM